MKTLTATATFIVASLCIQVKAISQEVDFERWEVGIDLLWLINKNVIPPSFFVKKMELKQRKNGTGYIRRGFRLRLGGSWSPEKVFPYETNNYNIAIVRPGYEWDIRFKSIDVFYGMDLMAQLQNYQFSNYDGYLNTARFSHLWLGISPFVGVKYKVYKNLSLSLESNFDILFVHTKESREYQNSETVTKVNNGLRMQANPLYVLNAIFTF